MSYTNLPGTATCEQTSYLCPEQYEGTFPNGRTYYFRMRFGRAWFGVGDTIEQAVEHSMTVHPPYPVCENAAHEPCYQGGFDDEEQRNRIFNIMRQECHE